MTALLSVTELVFGGLLLARVTPRRRSVERVRDLRELSSR